MHHKIRERWALALWFIVSAVLAASCSRSSPQEEVLIEMTAVVTEVTNILREIHTAEDALAAREELRRLQTRGFDIRKRMDTMTGKEIHWAAKDRVRRAFADNEAANREMEAEMIRLMGNREIMAVIAETLMTR
jgi:hypothetical protein